MKIKRGYRLDGEPAQNPEFLHIGCLVVRDTHASQNETEPASMNKSALGASYVRSLCWIVFFTAVIVGMKESTHLALMDFAYGKPHQTWRNLVFMMTAAALIIGFIAAIGSVLVFTLPQLFQAALVEGWHRTLGDRARFAALPALPFTAVLTWYCYDYLTPSNFAPGYIGPPSPPYQHGISISRYATALGVQAPVTLFSLLYLDTEFRRASRWPLLTATLIVTIGSGGIWGYVTAQGLIGVQSSER